MSNDNQGCSFLGFLIFPFLTISWFHGIYLGFHQGFITTLFAIFFPPYGALKGLLGFFSIYI